MTEDAARYVNEREWMEESIKTLEIENVDGRVWISVNGAPPFEVEQGHKISVELKRRGLFSR